MKKREVVLIKTVESLGVIGDVITVSNGYARNHLFPNKLAIPNGEFAQHLIASWKTKIEKSRRELTDSMERLQTEIESAELTIPVKVGENDKMYGSVNAMTLVDELSKIGVHIHKSTIKIPHGHISTLGSYSVPIHLSANHDTVLKVHVVNAEQPAVDERAESDDDAESTGAEPAMRASSETAQADSTHNETELNSGRPEPTEFSDQPNQ